MQEAVEKQREESLHSDSWQSYDFLLRGESETDRESRYRRNIRRRKAAADEEWKRAYKEDKRDSSGHLTRPRIANCGCAGFNRGSVEVVEGEKRPHAKGQAYCESVWRCPVCSEIIRRGKEAEVNQAVKKHLEAGGAFLLATFTIQHHKGQSLKDLQEVLLKSYSKMNSDYAFMKPFKKAYGIVGYIKNYEIMVGSNGWHPHCHVAVFLESSLTEEQFKVMEDEWKRKWMLEVEKRGGYATYENGLDIQIARDAEAVGSYISKELANVSDTKNGSGSLSPFQLLDDMTPENRRLWNEYVEATDRKHSMDWSKSLKVRLGINPKKDAELIKEADNQGEESLAYIGFDVWNGVQDDGALQEQALAAIAAHDYDHAAMILGCSYYMMSMPMGEDAAIYNHLPMFYFDNEQRRMKRHAYD